MKTLGILAAVVAVVMGVWFVRERQARSPWVPEEFLVGDAALDAPEVLPADSQAESFEEAAPAIGSAPGRPTVLRQASPPPSRPTAPAPEPLAPTSAPPGAMEPVGSLDSTPSVSGTEPQNTPGFFVQVGAFGETANAKRRASELQNEGFSVFSAPIETAAGQAVTAVRLGPFETRTEAIDAAARFVKKNPGQSTLVGEEKH